MILIFRLLVVAPVSSVPKAEESSYASGARLRILFTGDHQLPRELEGYNVSEYVPLEIQLTDQNPPAKVISVRWAIFISFLKPIDTNKVNFNSDIAISPQPLVEATWVGNYAALISVQTDLQAMPSGALTMSFLPVR